MHTLINKAIGKKERWERGGCRKGRKFYFWLFNVLWLLFKEQFLKILLCILILMNLHKNNSDFFLLQKNQIQSSHKIKINHQGYKGIVHLLKTIQVSLTHKQHTWISNL